MRHWLPLLRNWCRGANLSHSRVNSYQCTRKLHRCFRRENWKSHIQGQMQPLPSLWPAHCLPSGKPKGLWLQATITSACAKLCQSFSRQTTNMQLIPSKSVQIINLTPTGVVNSHCRASSKELIQTTILCLRPLNSNQLTVATPTSSIG